MGRLSKKQTEFANSMTTKQRRVLWALNIYPNSGYFMSASERADPELYELIRHKLVQCAMLGGGLPSWGLTDVRKRFAARYEKRGT